MQLSEIIIERVRGKGAIPFHDFMETALYEPGLGYYTREGEKIGPEGDYYTSSVLAPVFGAMIARQLEEMWYLLGKEPLTVVEYGAGTGALCRSILAELKNHPTLYKQLRYVIIEKSPSMREKEKANICEKVCWYDSIEQLGEFNGVVLSNELLDNFAVHRVVMKDELMEVFVAYEDGGFTEYLRPAGTELKDYLKQMNVSLYPGFMTEINLEAVRWIETVGQHLKNGFVLTIDYGYTAAELYHPSRSRGTLMCYHQHQVHEDPYQHIGEQDITAHVNFTALSHWGAKQGLEQCGFTVQGHFLRALGVTGYLRNLETNGECLQQLPVICDLLNGIGSKMKVLIQRKGLPPVMLSGLSLAIPVPSI
ncbi:MAG TPA: SAM-dependent methyltransferase [Mucilaginibacter sp.]|jgi:SAM-dependent MidA family methyltransferase